MSTTAQYLIDRLAQPPFSRRLNRLQLSGDASTTPLPGSDTLSVFGLLTLLHECIVHIDSVNPLSVHRTVSLRDEEASDTADRIVEYMRLMRYRPDPNAQSFPTDMKEKLLAGDRGVIMELMAFLLRNEVSLRKRAYLAPLLTPLDVPQDFMADEVIANLSRQVTQLQTQFKGTHRAHEEWREHSDARFEIKKEMKQMEEEKTQLQARIARLQRKVEHMPEHDLWLDAARKLRLEQAQEIEMKERLKENTQVQASLEQKLLHAQLRFRDVKSGVVPTPENMLQKIRDDLKVNKYLLKQKLEKTIADHTAHKQGIDAIRRRTNVDAEAIRAAEAHVAELNNTIARLTQQKAKDSGPIDDRLVVFRQQASMISNKKDVVAGKLQQQLDELKTAQEKLSNKQAEKSEFGVPSGDQFKKFASDIRSRAVVFKEKKKLGSQVAKHNNVLERTTEIMKARVLELKTLAERQGKTVNTEILRGSSQTADVVSKKREMTAEELAEELEVLTKNIEDEKSLLGPQVKELRQMRETVQDLEYRYQEKSRQYDAVMMGVDVENIEQEKVLKQTRAELETLQGRLSAANSALAATVSAEERVTFETKAYLGGDEQVEEEQKKRGFKTYRELYTKKIQELDTQSRSLREQQKENPGTQLSKVQQREMFLDVKTLMMTKIKVLKQINTASPASAQPVVNNAQLNTLVL